jgi:hypothetical protein
MLHPHDPMNDPTPTQSAIHERDCEIARLRDELREAVRLAQETRKVLAERGRPYEWRLIDASDLLMQIIGQHADILTDSPQN